MGIDGAGSRKGNGSGSSIFPPHERPPPTSLALRAHTLGPSSIPPTKHSHAHAHGGKRKGKSISSVGLKMWSGWGSKHDSLAVQQEARIEREEERVVRKASVVASLSAGFAPEGERSVGGEKGVGGRSEGLLSPAWVTRRNSRSRSRSRSASLPQLQPQSGGARGRGTRKRSVAYEGQIEEDAHVHFPRPQAQAHIPGQKENLESQEQEQESGEDTLDIRQQPGGNLRQIMAERSRSRGVTFAPVVLTPVVAVCAAIGDGDGEGVREAPT